MSDTPDSRWYKQEIKTRLTPEVAEVYAKWSGLEGDELIRHLHSVRDRAWPHAKYPCVGEWMFLQQSISRFPCFPSLVARVHSGETVLDLGCCFGQDLRLFAAAGAPTERMYALDLSGVLWELGYELFRDHERMRAEFLQADLLNDEAKMREWGHGRMDVILACQVLHLWSWERQVLAMKQCVMFSRPGTTLVGYQRGQDKAESVERDWGTMFVHDLDTFGQIWEQVQRETGTKWRCEFHMTDLAEWGLLEEDFEWMPAGCKFLSFVCRRE